MYKKNKTPGEIAEIIEHFVFRGPSEQQVRYDLEWNDLLDSGVSDPLLISIVKQCELINREFLPEGSLSEVAKLQREQDADGRLKTIAAQLREMEKRTKVSS
jgi:hypothetical protein